jgi:hypothetical protein
VGKSCYPRQQQFRSLRLQINFFFEVSSVALSAAKALDRMTFRVTSKNENPKESDPQSFKVSNFQPFIQKISCQTGPEEEVILAFKFILALCQLSDLDVRCSFHQGLKLSKFQVSQFHSFKVSKF